MAKNKKQVNINEDGEQVMSLTDHLKELRNRIIVCVAVLIVGFVVFLSQASVIVDMLTQMGIDNGYQFVYLSPQELMIQHIGISGMCAIVITVPVLAYECYAFMSPGLKKNENQFFMAAMIFGIICFVLGVLFAHKIAMPFMLNFLYKFNTTDYITAQISIESYLSFVMTVYIIFGIVFEMPVISGALTQFGLLNPEWLVKGRSVAIVAIFFVAAVITPPDIVSQIMTAIPMVALYQVSIIICKFIYKFKKKKDEDENEDDE
ncbi:MAG: twin-arginine translocase subunit TatC [Erysipelotrichaceae bacterium]|nr:twin-arginine translocase subunit TatC [Erysipelotrichaceae bacterium]